MDGFITVGDADLGRTQDGTGTDWRTMLVSGLGRGGKGFFALDITTPTAATDSAVADKVLWEFPASGSTDAANVGYSFSRPILVKHELVANDGTRSGAGWVCRGSWGSYPGRRSAPHRVAPVRGPTAIRRATAVRTGPRRPAGGR